MNMQINAMKVRQLRDQRCWSQQQLADMAGISLRTMQRLEAKSVASQETIKSLAAVLEISCDELLTEQVQENTVATEGNEARELQNNGEVDTKAKKQLYIGLAFVIAANLFGLFGVFNAYAEQKIDAETFVLLKNLLSFSLLVTVAVILFKGYRKGFFSSSDIY